MRSSAPGLLLAFVVGLGSAIAEGPISLTIGEMPTRPADLPLLLDWNLRARGLYERILPVRGDLSWLDRTGTNGVPETLGLPSYAGSYQQTPQTNLHEAITTMGAAYGAGLLHLPEAPWAARVQRAYLTAEGVVLNGPQGQSGGSFWYDLYPAVLLSLLVDQNPQDEGLKSAFRSTVERWYGSLYKMRTPGRGLDFHHSGFSLSRGVFVDDGHVEPDAAAGLAWIFYAGDQLFHRPQWKKAADECVRALLKETANPSYEVLMPWGFLAACRLQAGGAGPYDLDRLFRWSVDLDTEGVRPGISLASGSWGSRPVDGLWITWADGKPYAFAMNTFSTAVPLVAGAVSQPRFAPEVGRWLVNALVNARSFYPDQLPPEAQSDPEGTLNPGSFAAYEGLHSSWAGYSPYGLGDAVRSGWASTDFGLYGSVWSAVFASLAPRIEGDVVRLTLSDLVPLGPRRTLYLDYSLGGEKAEIVEPN